MSKTINEFDRVLAVAQDELRRGIDVLHPFVVEEINKVLRFVEKSVRKSSSVITVFEYQQEIKSLKDRVRQLEAENEQLRNGATIVTDEEEDDLCMICYERKADQSLGCSHSLCSVCLPRVDKCPMCRTSVCRQSKYYDLTSRSIGNQYAFISFDESRRDLELAHFHERHSGDWDVFQVFVQARLSQRFAHYGFDPTMLFCFQCDIDAVISREHRVALEINDWLRERMSDPCTVDEIIVYAMNPSIGVTLLDLFEALDGIFDFKSHFYIESIEKIADRRFRFGYGT